jgi:phage N-6-adenine-methyltransferase
MDDILFSRQRSDWATPPNILKLCKKLAHVEEFDLDPCAAKNTAKATKFYTEETDGLSQPWHGNVFVNPPYGRAIGAWIEKAIKELNNGNAKSVTFLLPARTDTRWFALAFDNAEDIYFLQGRITFVGAKYPAPFPSVIIFMRPNGQCTTTYATVIEKEEVKLTPSPSCGCNQEFKTLANPGIRRLEGPQTTPKASKELEYIK